MAADANIYGALIASAASIPTEEEGHPNVSAQFDMTYTDVSFIAFVHSSSEGAATEGMKFVPCIDISLRQEELLKLLALQLPDSTAPAQQSMLNASLLLLARIVNQGIHVDPAMIDLSKIGSLLSFPEIRQVFGPRGLLRRFIEGFSKIAKPMTKLTQKKIRFEWSDKAGAAFQLIKQKLCSAPILALPEGSEDFIAYCDASIKGLGAVLMQRGNSDCLCIRQLKDSLRKNYKLMIWELGEVVFASKDWRHYCTGQKVYRTVHDHKIFCKYRWSCFGCQVRNLKNETAPLLWLVNVALGDYDCAEIRCRTVENAIV
ncbi:putative reverse transcriptase domain-containing protein [Tanacetum coccineum]